MTATFVDRKPPAPISAGPPPDIDQVRQTAESPAEPVMSARQHDTDSVGFARLLRRLAHPMLLTLLLLSIVSCGESRLAAGILVNVPDVHSFIYRSIEFGDGSLNRVPSLSCSG